MSEIVRKFSEHELKVLDKKSIKLDKKPLNSGSFAQVYRGKYQGESVAVKVIDCEKTSEQYIKKFLPRELYTLKKLKHRFIIQVSEILTISNRIFIVLELAEGGDLIEVLQKNKGPIPEPKAQIYYKQISEALDYIHSNAISHRDIKAENVLFNKDLTVAKLTDFGFARTCFDNLTGRRLLTTTQCGTLTYASPELLSGQPFDAMKSDVWSIGIVLYILVLNKLPFTGSNTRKMRKKQMNRVYDIVTEEISHDCKDLIYKLLEPNVKLRLNMKQVLNHKWLRSVKI